MRLLRRRSEERDATELLDAAAERADDGAAADALRLLERARATAKRNGDREAELVALLEIAALENDEGRFARAEQAARSALCLDPESDDAREELCEALYRQGRFLVLQKELTTWTSEGDAPAWAWHRLGRTEQWLGDPAAARVAFRRAHDLEPHTWPVPVRIAAPEFDRIAGRALAEVPPGFRARLGNLLIVAEALPDFDEVTDGQDPDILGVYEGGTALDEEGDGRIVLYQLNHEVVCGSLGELIEEVRRTVLHEIGHHFGMDDHELPY